MFSFFWACSFFVFSSVFRPKGHKEIPLRHARTEYGYLITEAGKAPFHAGSRTQGGDKKFQRSYELPKVSLLDREARKSPALCGFFGSKGDIKEDKKSRKGG